jgi:hypothetical protein
MWLLRRWRLVALGLAIGIGIGIAASDFGLPAKVGFKRFVYYPNCSVARAAGAAPIRRDEPGYRPELDADDDGIACEPYYRH